MDYEDMEEDEFRDFHDEAYYSRRTTSYSPHPDDRYTEEDEEEQWVLDAIAQHEHEMYEEMAEEHMREMAAQEAKLAGLECSQKLKGETA